MSGKQWKISVITATLGDLGDRFCPSYKDSVSFADKVGYLAKERGLDGVELVFDSTGEEGNADHIRTVLSNTGLAVSAVNIPFFREPIWKMGSFSSPDKSVRLKAIDIARKGIDFAAKLDCSIINLWLGQDGLDYPFQYDYKQQWENLVEGIGLVADHQPDMKICLESKPREPRNRSLLDTPATTLLAAQDTGRDNVGLTIDIGHVFMSQQNAAQAIELAAQRGRLFNIHINDNYGAWDDDLTVGSVRIVEFVELFYSLRKIGYSGWCSIDIFPFRESPEGALQESVRSTLAIDAMVDKLGMKEIESWIRAEDSLAGVRAMREHLFGKV